MYKPDHVIVRKIKQYDPALYVKYNNRKGYFEIWREMAWGHRIITPVVPTIFDTKESVRFMQLDDRILWWLYEADSWRQKNYKQYLLEQDRRFLNYQKKKAQSRSDDFKNAGKDMYSVGMAEFVTRHEKKNDTAKALRNAFKTKNNWVKPDSKALTAHRVWARSGQNAKLYNFKRQK